MTHTRRRARTHPRDQEVADMLQGGPLSHTVEGLLPADRTVDFVGLAVRSAHWQWRVHAYGALYP